MGRVTPLDAMHTAAKLAWRDWQAIYPESRGIGVTCTYVPDELLHAAGFTPVRLRRTGPPARRAELHLQSYTCSVCKSTLDRMLAGETDAFAGVVFAHSCDTMQAMADVCRLSSGNNAWFETVMQPTNLDSSASAPYLLAELGRLRARLADLAGRPIRDQDLDASITLYDETRRLVQALAPHRERLSATDYYAILGAAQSMPRERFNPLLSALLEEMEEWKPKPGRPRVYLCGAVLDLAQIVELMDALGACVAGDDLCSGSRHFVGRVGRTGDPLERLVEHTLQRPPCPCKRHTLHHPARSLIEQVRCVKAKGVVFLLETYCEPHAFEQGRVRTALDHASIPYQTLEMEQQSNIEGLRTRLEAFLEML